MTEAEYLQSTDPAAMLEHLHRQACHRNPYTSNTATLLSDRKLKLFAEAGGCPECVAQASGLEPSRYAEYVAGASCRTRAYRAHLLRDIFENPWRPVTLDAYKEVLRRGNAHAIMDKHPAVTSLQRACELETASRAHWRTSTVVALARAVREQTVRRKCERCDGRKEVLIQTNVMGILGWTICPDCTAGSIDTGIIDGDRLAVLADALLEAEMPEKVECEHCDGKGWYWPAGRECPTCAGTGRMPHPILAHLRSGEVHVRGCWVIELLTGDTAG